MSYSSDKMARCLSTIPGMNVLEKGLICCCDTYRMKILYFLQACILMLGIAFFSVAMHAASACYVSPCYDAKGLDIMWKVDNGLSFEAATSGVCYMIHPLFGLIFLYKKCETFTAGIFVGLGMLLCLNAIVDSVIWGTKANMMTDMSSVYYHNTKAMVVNESVFPLFTSLSTFSGLIFTFELISLVMFTYATESLIGSTSLAGTDVSDVGGTQGKSYGGTYQSNSATTNTAAETDSLMVSEAIIICDDADEFDDNPFDD